MIENYLPILLHNKPIEKNFSKAFLKDLCCLMKERKFVPNEYLFKENDKSEDLYFLIRGDIRIKVGP